MRKQTEQLVVGLCEATSNFEAKLASQDVKEFTDCVNSMKQILPKTVTEEFLLGIGWVISLFLEDEAPFQVRLSAGILSAAIGRSVADGTMEVKDA